MRASRRRSAVPKRGWKNQSRPCCVVVVAFSIVVKGPQQSEGARLNSRQVYGESVNGNLSLSRHVVHAHALAQSPAFAKPPAMLSGI